MKKYGWLIAILGVFILGVMLIFGAALGAGITYYFLQANPVQAAFAAPVEVTNDPGVLIASVDPDSPAAEAGLVRGDILLEVNGVAVNNLLDLKSVLSEIEPGESAELTVLHGDDTRSLIAELGDHDGLAYLGVDTCGTPMGGSRMFTDPSGDVMIKGFGLGAEVTEVITGSPADEAGLLVGDLIISVNGEKISPGSSLVDLIQAYEPGDTVTLEIQSAEADESHQVDVILGENPDSSGMAYLGVGYRVGSPSLDFNGGELPEGFENWDDLPHFYFHNGEEFQDKLPEGGEDKAPFSFEMPALPELPEGVESAVIISEVMEDTPASEADLQPGDLILAVDGNPVTEVATFVDAMQSHKPGDEVTLTIFRGNEELKVAVTLSEHPDYPERGFLGVLAGTFSLQTPEEFNQDSELDLPGVPGGDA